MFGSTALEIAIGLIFVYWLLSLFCSALTEAIAARLNLRSKGLEKAIRQILGDSEGNALAADFFAHPLINALKQKGPMAKSTASSGVSGSTDPSQLPSYIPSRTFAVTLFDLLCPTTDGTVLTIDRLRQSIHDLAFPSSKEVATDNGKTTIAKALWPIVQHAGDSVDQMLHLTEVWFDDSMNRLSGWYKSHSQQIVWVTALLVVLFTNADTLMIVRKLSKEPTLRNAVVQQSVEKLAKEPRSDDAVKKLRGEDPPEPYGDDYWEKQAAKADPKVRELRGELNALNLLGWTLGDPDPTLTTGEAFWKQVGGNASGLIQKIVGLLLTMLAVSLGAPFWFDLLNRLVNLRATGPKPEPPTPPQMPEKHQVPAVQKAVQVRKNPPK